jgi:hypothetical protein
VRRRDVVSLRRAAMRRPARRRVSVDTMDPKSVSGSKSVVARRFRRQWPSSFVGITHFCCFVLLVALPTILNIIIIPTSNSLDDNLAFYTHATLIKPSQQEDGCLTIIILLCPSAKELGISND